MFNREHNKAAIARRNMIRPLLCSMYYSDINTGMVFTYNRYFKYRIQYLSQVIGVFRTMSVTLGTTSICGWFCFYPM